MGIRKITTRRAGFTLIEVLIYVAFFSFLIGSLLAITFQTIDSTSRINKKITVQQEADFVLRKLEWVLNGSESVDLPPLGGSGPELNVNNSNLGIFSPAIFSSIDSNINLKLGSEASLPLTTQNINISNLNFTHSQEAGQPEKIIIDFEVGKESFKLIKYLR